MNLDIDNLNNIVINYELARNAYIDHYHGDISFNEAFENNVGMVKIVYDAWIKSKFKSPKEHKSEVADSCFGFMCVELARFLESKAIDPKEITSATHYKKIILSRLYYSAMGALIFDNKGKEIPEGYEPPYRNNVWTASRYEDIVFLRELPELIKKEALSNSRFGETFDKAARYIYDCQINDRKYSPILIEKTVKGFTCKFIEDWVAVNVKKYLYKIRNKLPDLLNFKYSFEYMFHDFKVTTENLESAYE